MDFSIVKAQKTEEGRGNRKTARSPTRRNTGVNPPSMMSPAREPIIITKYQPFTFAFTFTFALPCHALHGPTFSRVPC